MCLVKFWMLVTGKQIHKLNYVHKGMLVCDFMLAYMIWICGWKGRYYAKDSI